MRSIINVKILGHSWGIRFMPRGLMHDQNNGTCWLLHKRIDICDDLTKEEATFVLTHELAHAFMGMSGRTFEDNLSAESVCETIAWHVDELVMIRDKIINERFGSKNER